MQVGRHTYGSPKVYGNKGLVSIGSFCSIAKGVTILSNSEHQAGFVSTFPFAELIGAGNKQRTGKGRIIIGNDVWIGFGVTILSGVTIGHGAIIGAGAVVSKDVAPYTIAAGNPIREIRKRFSEPVVKQLLELKWWDWSDEKIMENANFLTSAPGKWSIDYVEI